MEESLQDCPGLLKKKIKVISKKYMKSGYFRLKETDKHNKIKHVNFNQVLVWIKDIIDYWVNLNMDWVLD